MTRLIHHGNLIILRNFDYFTAAFLLEALSYYRYFSIIQSNISKKEKIAIGRKYKSACKTVKAQPSVLNNAIVTRRLHGTSGINTNDADTLSRRARTVLP